MDGIQFEKIIEWYEMTQLETKIDSWMDCMTPAHTLFMATSYTSPISKRNLLKGSKNEKM